MIHVVLRRRRRGYPRMPTLLGIRLLPGRREVSVSQRQWHRAGRCRLHFAAFVPPRELLLRECGMPPPHDLLAATPPGLKSLHRCLYSAALLGSRDRHFRTNHVFMLEGSECRLIHPHHYRDGSVQFADHGKLSAELRGAGGVSRDVGLGGARCGRGVGAAGFEAARISLYDFRVNG